LINDKIDVLIKEQKDSSQLLPEEEFSKERAEAVEQL
jgi:hypothetical protein